MYLNISFKKLDLRLRSETRVELYTLYMIERLWFAALPESFVLVCSATDFLTHR